MRRGKSRWKDLGQPPILRFLPFSTLLSFFSSIHPAYLLSTFSSFSLLFLPFFDPYSYRTTLRFPPFVFHRFLRSPRLAPFLSPTSFTLHFNFSLLSTRQILSFFSFLPLLIKFHSPVRFLCSPASLFPSTLSSFPATFYSVSLPLASVFPFCSIFSSVLSRSDRSPYSPAFPCLQPFLLHSSAFCLFSFFLSLYFPLSLKPFLSGVVNGRSEFKRQRATSFFQSISPRLLLFSLNRATSV